jgi:transketolase
MADPKLDNLCITTMRMLAVDMVQTAKSGHPGMPLGASPAAYVIWDRILKHSPKDPLWHDRDRFVLSAGHACAMLYALLHLTGYDLPLDDLKRFRQVDSKCPGHPEVHLTPGVEATAGPLGQGISNAVGMAIAERHLAAIFNRPGHEIVDHHTFVMCSDGDMMEGVASEACSLAGFLKLGRLVALYDDNGISIEGKTHELAFNEDIRGRFEAYGWQVIDVKDLADLDAVEKAVRAGMAEDTKPTLIWGRSQIGAGSPIAGTSKVHGEPMNDQHASETRKYYEWDECPAFCIPDEALAHFREAVTRGGEAEKKWSEKFQAYSQAHPDLAKRFTMMMSGDLPEGWEKSLPVFAPGKEAATRNAGGEVMNAIAKAFEGYLVGGSADLSPSTKTIMNGFGDIKPGDFAGMNMHFGVREHAMGSIMNGMALHRGIIPFGATFMVFCDYMRPPIRIAAISSLPVIYVFTHDSIGVGEDGPTHQPVEHVAALRAIPNMMVLRPADANETAAAWKVALERRDGPTVLALTRQNLPILDVAKYPIQQGVPRGAYILSEAEGGGPQVILIATGSEVTLALQAQGELAKEGMRARVVSMPSMELFEAQDAAYRDKVLPPAITARLVVEAGVRLGWDRYIGPKGDGIWQQVFGVSGPYKHVFKKVGFTVENVVRKAKDVLARQ